MLLKVYRGYAVSFRMNKVALGDSTTDISCQFVYIYYTSYCPEVSLSVALVTFLAYDRSMKHAETEGGKLTSLETT